MINTQAIHIHDIIPQREPFVLIEQLTEHSDNSATTTFSIQEEHVLVEDGVLTEAGLLENMAQTAAAQLGYIAFINGIKTPLGFIAAVRNYEASDFPKVGEKIETKILYTSKILNIHVVNAEVLLHNEKIASCELKIFIQE